MLLLQESILAALNPAGGNALYYMVERMMGPYFSKTYKGPRQVKKSDKKKLYSTAVFWV